jgi:hypothetical protein
MIYEACRTSCRAAVVCLLLFLGQLRFKPAGFVYAELRYINAGWAPFQISWPPVVWCWKSIYGVILLPSGMMC